MNNISRYIIIIAIISLFVVIAWSFSSIIACILISAVLSLLGHPVMELFGKIKICKHKSPDGIASLFSLLLLAGVIVGVIFFITPLIGQIVAEMSAINFDELNHKLSVPLWKYNNMLYEFFPTMDRNLTIERSEERRVGKEC